MTVKQRNISSNELLTVYKLTYNYKIDVSEFVRNTGWIPASCSRAITYMFSSLEQMDELIVYVYHRLWQPSVVHV